MRMHPRGGDGPEVTFVPGAAEDALEVADDQQDVLLDDWRPEDVALLTTGARHPEQVALQESEGQDGYWATFWDKDLVFYGHVLGFKGLERRVVVLCVNDQSLKERARERLYVGLSRATDQLVVVGEACAPTSSGAVRVTSAARPVVSGTAAIRPSVATALRTTSWAMSWVDAMPLNEPLSATTSTSSGSDDPA